MDSTAFDILQALGIGLAFGLRPAVAPILVAIFASLGWGVDLDGTVVEFLGGSPAIVGLVVFAVIWIALDATSGRINQWVHLLVAVVFAAAFGAGVVDENSELWWPGALAGAAGAALAWAALTPILAGVRQRLAGEQDAGLVLPAMTELAAVVTAFLSLIFPPLAVIAALACLVLIFRSRRGDQRYAGLRTLTK